MNAEERATWIDDELRRRIFSGTVDELTGGQIRKDVYVEAIRAAEREAIEKCLKIIAWADERPPTSGAVTDWLRVQIRAL